MPKMTMKTRLDTAFIDGSLSVLPVCHVISFAISSRPARMTKKKKEEGLFVPHSARASSDIDSKENKKKKQLAIILS
jgi:hypothetical protein